MSEGFGFWGIKVQPVVGAYKGSEPYVFVCYAHSDSAVVYPEIQWLHERGCNIWYDEGIAPGHHWREEIARTIQACSLFIIYLSPRSVISEECQKELSFALDKGIPVLAIFVEKFELTPGLQLSLQNRQAIERFRYQADPYQIKLLNSINLLIGVAENSDVPPRTTKHRRKVIDDQISLAILPFDNFSSDPEHVYLAEGLTQDLTTLFARIPEFFVISRNSLNAYTRDKTDIASIAHELAVRYVVSGSVRSSGSRLRVTVELVEAESGAALWAQQINREIADLFDVQDEITQTVCAQLQPTLTLSEIRHNERQNNLSAWTLFQKGWAIWNFNYTKPDSEEALKYIHQALDLDSDYAIANAALTVIYANRAGSGWTSDPRSELAKAQEYARKSLLLAPGNPFVLYSQAVLRNAIGSRLEAQQYAERAVLAEPCNPAYQALAGLLFSMHNDTREGVDRCLHALELSPFDPRLHMHYAILAMSHMQLGEWSQMADAAEQSLQAKHDNSWGWMLLLIASLHVQDNAKAQLAIQRIHEFASFDAEAFAEISIKPNEQITDEKAIRAQSTMALLNETDVFN